MHRVTKQTLDSEGGEDAEGVDRGSPKSVRGNYPSTAGNLGRWKVERGVWIQCVDYSTRMETIMAEMRVLFDSRNRFFRGSPIPLEKFSDLTDFPDLPPADL